MFLNVLISYDSSLRRPKATLWAVVILPAWMGKMVQWIIAHLTRVNRSLNPQDTQKTDVVVNICNPKASKDRWKADGEITEIFFSIWTVKVLAVKILDLVPIRSRPSSQPEPTSLLQRTSTTVEYALLLISSFSMIRNMGPHKLSCEGHRERASL